MGRAAPNRNGRVSQIDGKNAVRLGPDHPNEAIGILALMQAIGTIDPAFYEGMISHLVNASGEDGLSEEGANFMLSVSKGFSRETRSRRCSPLRWPP